MLWKEARSGGHVRREGGNAYDVCDGVGACRAAGVLHHVKRWHVCVIGYYAKVVVAEVGIVELNQNYYQ